MITRHPHGITRVDTEYVRPGFDAAYVLVRDGRAGIIDAGARSAVPLLLRALDELAVARDAVDWLLVTHVHLDHAGGAGALLEHLPSARVLVHPRGAPHLADPTRLEQATIAVYGPERFEQLYGKLVPISPARIHQTRDGEYLTLGSSELSILHTPGHALHHQVLFDAGARAAFTGDTFGLAYPELATPAGSFIVPTTTPTQFDPEQLVASIRRIAALEPGSLYLTHYGRVENVSELAAALEEQIERLVTLARACAPGVSRRARLRSSLREYWIERAAAHGMADAAAKVDAVLTPDIELNAQGLEAWLSRTEKSKAT